MRKYANATATGTVSDNDLITILLSRHELGMLEAHTPLKRVLNHLAGTKSQDLMTASQARTVVQPTTEYLQTPSPKSRGDRQETKKERMWHGPLQHKESQNQNQRMRTLPTQTQNMRRRGWRQDQMLQNPCRTNPVCPFDP